MPNDQTSDPLKDALLRFYKAVMAEWAAPANRQRHAEVLHADQAVFDLLHPGEHRGGMPFGGQSL
jgi:hypothetical protein